MTLEMNSTNQTQVLDEIIDSAAGLPVESQDLLLMIAKAMRYTRRSIMRKSPEGTDRWEKVSGELNFKQGG